jgi:DNA-binding response OmpR family regulator
MGPCPTEESARATLDEQRPDAVVLDINLGSGATFKLAEMLKDRGVPFVVLTEGSPAKQ